MAVIINTPPKWVTNFRHQFRKKDFFPETGNFSPLPFNLLQECGEGVLLLCASRGPLLNTQATHRIIHVRRQAMAARVQFI